METRANYVMVGSFVLIVLIAMFAAVLWLGNSQFNRELTYYDVYFSGSVTGLGVGAAVNYNGVAIGRVSSIELDPQNPEQVLVTLEINSRVPIKSDAVASLESSSFVTGVAYVEISGGSRDAPSLEALEGQRYPVIASRPSEFQSVVDIAPEVINRVSLVADRLAELLDDKNRAAVAATLQNVEKLTGNAAAEVNKLDPVIDNANLLIGDLRKTAHSADTLIDKLDGSVATLDMALNSANGMVTDLRPGLRSFSENTLPQVHQLVIDLRTLTGSLTRVSDQLERDPARFLFGEHRPGYSPK